MEPASALETRHDPGEFDCGTHDLNTWLIEQARRAQIQGTANTYVWADADIRVVGYYAVTPHQVRREEVSSGMAGGMSGLIPGWLLARLALDKSLHGQGLGGVLLRDALQRILAAAEIGSGRLIAVDAIDPDAAAFYRHFDFVQVKGNPHRLVIKVSTVRQAAGG